MLKFQLNAYNADDLLGTTDTEVRQNLAKVLRDVADRIEQGDSLDTYRNATFKGDIVGTFVMKDHTRFD